MTVIGTGFDGTMKVTVGGTVASEIEVTGTTTMRFRTPAANGAGSSEVVFSANGKGSVVLSAGFTYNAPPSVDLPVQPASGPLNGGGTIAIEGSNFLGTVNVSFGSVPAEDVVVVGSSRIQCTLPSAAGAGPVSVQIDCSASGTVNIPAGFLYNPGPSISTAITPAAGAQDGFTPIVIRGANFFGNVSVSVGGNPASNISVTGGTQIDCLSPPAGASGNVSVMVACSASGSVLVPGGFTYNPRPVISGVINPSSGLTIGGNGMAIQGSNFLGSITVMVGNSPATSVNVSGGMQITCVAPASSTTGPVAVTVISSTHGSVTRDDGYTYVPTVTIDPTLLPNNGTQQGGTRVSISGTNFLGVTNVRFNFVDATNIVVHGPTLLTCDTPASTPASSNLQIITAANGTALVQNAYTFNPQPTISPPVTPSSAPIVGTDITIHGTNLLGTVSVTIGSAPATNLVVTSGTTITCTAPPAAAAGSADVIVVSSSHGTATLVGGFTYDPLVTFNTSTTFAVGNGPRGAACGDVNRDGAPDLVVANELDDTVSVLLGDGAGSYLEAGGSPLASAGGPTGVALADLDRDGTLDILTGNATTGVMRQFFGDGFGTFTEGATSPYIAGAGARQPVVGDFDRDGTLDVAITNPAAGTVSVFQGGAGGILTEVTGSPFNAGTTPGDVVVADFDGDAVLDLAIVDESSGTVEILLGDGAPGFFPAAGSPLMVGTQPRSIAVADIDQDGAPDLVVANRGSGDLTVLLGDGSSGFTEASDSPIALGGAPEDLAITDLDGNGELDLVASLASALSVLGGVGTGAFYSPSTYPGGSAFGSIVVEDANRDGRPDVHALDDGPPGSAVLYFNTTSWVGTGGLGSPTSFAPSTSMYNFALGDLNRDGLVDVLGTNDGLTPASLTRVMATGVGSFDAATEFQGGSFSVGVHTADVNRDGRLDVIVPERSPQRLRIFLGDGAGNFPTINAVALPTFPEATTVGDFDRDGQIDVAVLASSNVFVFEGDGAGGFAAGATLTGGGDRIDCADVDRDGDLDLVFTESFFNEAVYVFLGDGAGNFSQSGSSPISVSDAAFFGIGDFDRDGRLDLAVTRGFDSQISFLAGDGAGGFTVTGSATLGTLPTSVAILDLNRDGILDLAVINRTSRSISLLEGSGSGTFPTITTVDTSAFSFQPEGLAVHDSDRDGIPDLFVGNATFGGFNVLPGR